MVEGKEIDIVRQIWRVKILLAINGFCGYISVLRGGGGGGGVKILFTRGAKLQEREREVRTMSVTTTSTVDVRRGSWHTSHWQTSTFI